MTREFYSPVNEIAEGTARTTLSRRATEEHGARGELPLFYRYVVLETIFDPTIIDDNKIAYFEHALQVSNINFAKALPRNTIIGQRVLKPGTPASVMPMFLFPMLPPTISLPCQPGEHVWVMFENQTGSKNDMGYWLCRIVEPGYVEDVNHTHAPRTFDPQFSPGTRENFQNNGQTTPTYELRNGATGIKNGERFTVAETATLNGDEDAYESLLTETDGGRLTVIEPVPRYRKRPGDLVLEGSNNALIVLGRDRVSATAELKQNEDTGAQDASSLPVSDSQGAGAGTIDIVVGRGQTEKTGGRSVSVNRISGDELANARELAKHGDALVPAEGDPDFSTDRSRVYVSQRTKVDKNFGLDEFNSLVSKGTVTGGDATKKSVKDNADGDGAVVIKSDKLRLIARSDLEIIVSSYSNRDPSGRLVASDDTNDWCAIVLKANGDIVFKPSKNGYIKLGSDNANKGIVCSDTPVTPVNGGISGAPLTTTMGGFFAGAKPQGDDNGPALSPGQAKFSNKVLIE